MATIGNFQRTSDGFTGQIRTAVLNIRARFVPMAPSEKGPAYKIVTGASGSPTVELGAAWQRSARETGMPYLSCKLDDPAFPEPIFASLVEDSKGPGHSLIWSRRQD